MNRCWAARILCLLAVIGMVIVCGCSAMNAYSPERKRRRAYSVRTDLNRMVDDVDWIMGWHRPTRSFDESMR